MLKTFLKWQRLNVALGVVLLGASLIAALVLGR